MKFRIVTFPKVQKYLDKGGFKENAMLINDREWIEVHGLSAYFVSEEFIKQVNRQKKAVQIIKYKDRSWIVPKKKRVTWDETIAAIDKAEVIADNLDQIQTLFNYLQATFKEYIKQNLYIK